MAQSWKNDLRFWQILLVLQWPTLLKKDFLVAHLAVPATRGRHAMRRPASKARAPVARGAAPRSRAPRSVVLAAAAVRIQAFYRGRLGRLLAARCRQRREQEKLEEELQNKAEQKRRKVWKLMKMHEVG